MAFENQSVVVKVRTFLGHLLQVGTVTANVRRIADHRQLRHAAAHLDGKVPHRVVAVERSPVSRKPAVDQPDVFDTRIPDTRHSAYPQVEIGRHRVLDQHRDIGSLQRIGNLLHTERIARATRTDPEHVGPEFERCLDMLGRSYLQTERQPRLLARFAHPGEPLKAHAFERSRFRTRFPDAGPKHVHHAGSGDLLTSFYGLFLGFRTARPRYDQRPFCL